MKNDSILNLFEFWEHIGSLTGTYNIQKTYSAINQKDFLWPSKVFKSDLTLENLHQIHQKINNASLPNSLNILETSNLKTLLLKQGFELKSELETMTLSKVPSSILNAGTSTVTLVNSSEKATKFAQIASLSFNYGVLPATIIDLLKSNIIQSYIGKHNGEYVTCGMLFKDKNDHVGLHMIGTVSEARGLGLGKIMTQKLLQEAAKMSTKNSVLVASKAGAFIYKKMGFEMDGALNTYYIKHPKLS